MCCCATGDSNAVERQTFYEVADDRDDRGPTTAARMQRYEVEAPTLAEQACRQALQSAGLEPQNIDHLVTVSCSGFNAPGFDLALYPRLGLDPNTSRTHVGFMGCHGALNAMRVATSLAKSAPDTNVLVCAVELCTLHHQYTDEPQQIVANSLFADGAAAAIVSNRTRPTATASTNGHARSSSDWHIIASGSFLVPESTEAMSWRIGDNGFCMTLSAQVPELIKSQLKPWLESWLARHDHKLSDIASWAVHPGGPRILSATASALELEKDALDTSIGVLSECGNMSSPTILFILDRLRQQQAPRPCVALAFGPGLVVEALLLR